MEPQTSKQMLIRERAGRHAFLIDRDGFDKTAAWYAVAWRIYLAAACNAYGKENKTWGLIWSRSAKACQRIAEEMTAT